MPWNDIVGHRWAVDLLRRDLAGDRLRHAYLFTGPPGMGKRTLATTFAQALLCPQPEPPCGRCRHCRLAERGGHPDLFTVAPVVSGKRILSAKIKIEAVRDLIYAISLKPVEAQRRVALLLQFDAAEAPAQNAFLKTLEEPPGNAVILITASQAESLLPTIASRCEILPLRPLPAREVEAALTARWGVPAARATLLAHLSGGRPGEAVRLQADDAALRERDRRLDDLRRLFSASRVERFAYAEELSRSSNSDQIQTVLELWTAFLRDLMLAAIPAPAPPFNPDRADDLRSLAARLTAAGASACLRAVERTLDAMRRNVNLRLALEVLMLDLPHLG